MTSRAQHFALSPGELSEKRKIGKRKNDGRENGTESQKKTES